MERWACRTHEEAVLKKIVHRASRNHTKADLPSGTSAMAMLALSISAINQMASDDTNRSRGVTGLHLKYGRGRISIMLHGSPTNSLKTQ